MVSISVIIPAYNQAAYLAEAIESVLAQTVPPHELIVIDDGSTDNSAEIAQSYKQVTYIYQQNKGLAGARNSGLLAASGDFVALLDSDDSWLPTYLEEMNRLIAKHPASTVFYCAAKCMSADGHALPQIVGGVRNRPSVRDALLRANHIIPSTVTFRRQPVVDAGLFDAAFRRLEDRELWLRLLKQGAEFTGTDQALIRYRLHGASLSRNATKMQEAAFAVAVKHFGSDDNNYANWPADKRMVYGGVYRYCSWMALTAAQDWDEATNFLRKAMRADNSLATELGVVL